MPKKELNYKKSCAEITADMKVSLCIELKDEIKGIRNALSLNSVVEEVSGDGALLIHMPSHQGYHYPLPRDEDILLHFWVDSKMYALPVRFQERFKRDNLVFARLLRRGAVKEGQRRSCYRLPCSLPVNIERRGKEPSEGKMSDFSDGGMLFATDEDMERGEKITLTFDTGEIETTAAVVLRAERAEGGNYKYRAAVQFKHKDKKQKDRFYKFIVIKQMEERRRQTQGIQPPYLLNNGKKEGLDDSVSVKE